MSTVVAFDLDDTLFREWDYVRSGYRAVGRAVAERTGADAEQIAADLFRHRPEGYEHIASTIPGAPTPEEMVAIYRVHKPEIELIEGVRNLLDTLKERACILVLITDGRSATQRAKIEALGIEHYFDLILISSETGGDKYTPIPWETVEKRYPGARLTYIGDNPAKDFHLPNLRGWTTAMPLASHSIHPQSLSLYPPEYHPQIIFRIEN